MGNVTSIIKSISEYYRRKFPPGSARNALLVTASVTVCVKALSFFKEILVARAFGVGDVVDAYTLVLTLVASLTGLFGNAIRPVLLPSLVEAERRSAREEGELGFAAVRFLKLVGGALVVLILVGYLFAGPLLAGKLSQNARAYARSMVWVLAFVPFFWLSFHWGSTVLEKNKCFKLPAAAEGFPAVGIIILLFLVGPWPMALALGTILGMASASLVVGIKARSQLSRDCSAEAQPLHKSLRPLVTPFSSMVGATAATMLIGLTDVLVASWLGKGVPSALGYSQRVIAVFTGLIAAVLARVGLPYISELVDQPEAFIRRLRRWRSLALSAGFILSVALTLGAVPLVQVLFQRGAFTALDTQAVAKVVVAFSWQLPFLFASTFYVQAAAAFGRQHLLMLITIVSFFVNGILDVWMGLKFGASGIAWSTSLTYASSFILLLVSFHLFLKKDFNIGKNLQ